jgi:hypothetical protein
MTRRIVRDDCNLEVIRERDGRLTRTITTGAVLNILQWVRPGQARFTLEGEGAEVWVCEETAITDATAP